MVVLLLAAFWFLLGFLLGLCCVHEEQIPLCFVLEERRQ